ncbi:MAG: septum formation protein Maf [Planctomycetota bacterium]|nr:MAG: septum formation protein Maf [Planctomycetota bacterium]
MQFKRFFYRRFIKPVVTAHDTPHAVALGMAVGMFVALTPTIGIQMIIAAFICTLLGANRLVAVAMVWLSNPLTAAPIYWFDHYLGIQILGGADVEMWVISEKISQVGLTDWWAITKVLTGDIFWPMMIGGAVFGLALAVPLYPVALWALNARRRRISGKVHEKLNERRLVLASASPRRQAMLREWGYEFDVMEPNVRETAARRLNPTKTARHNARLKANDVARRVKDAVVVAADTITVLEKNLIGKPGDEADAKRMLRELSGTRHSVITAMCAVDTRTGKTIVAHDEAFVYMREMTDAEISEYVRSGEGMGKSGAYAARAEGDRFIRKIEGNLDTVVGFPRFVFNTMMYRLLARPRIRRKATRRRVGP